MITTEKLHKSEKQRIMHKDFFDRSQLAIDQGFYLEAICMEYAAMEGRLEVLLGVLCAPCNHKLPDTERKKFQISHRIVCLEKTYTELDLFENSKLNKSYFKSLEKWIESRNRYIHGLYKNEIMYEQRVKDKTLARKGLEFCRTLYDETNRVKRLMKRNPELGIDIKICASSNCHHCRNVINDIKD